MKGKVGLLYEKDPLAACAYQKPVPVQYSAKNYPSTVFTTYLQGTWDPRTSYPEAVNHFMKVAQGNAQLVAVLGGGHMPSGQIAVNGSVDQQSLLKIIFNKIFLAQRLTLQDLKLFDTKGEFKTQLIKSK